MALNDTLVAALRAMMAGLGHEAITVEGTASPVDALVSDKGVCLPPPDVADHAAERARYAVARVVRADLATMPQAGDEVSMLGTTWQVRRVQPVGLAGAGLVVLHCVGETYSRGR